MALYMCFMAHVWSELWQEKKSSRAKRVTAAPTRRSRGRQYRHEFVGRDASTEAPQKDPGQPALITNIAKVQAPGIAKVQAPRFSAFLVCGSGSAEQGAAVPA